MSVKIQNAGDINADLDRGSDEMTTGSPRVPGHTKEQKPGSPQRTENPNNQLRQNQKTMVKRIVTTSVGLLGLSIAVGYADMLRDQAPTVSFELPPQSVVSSTTHLLPSFCRFSFHIHSSSTHGLLPSYQRTAPSAQILSTNISILPTPNHLSFRSLTEVSWTFLGLARPFMKLRITRLLRLRMRHRYTFRRRTRCFSRVMMGAHLG